MLTTKMLVKFVLSIHMALEPTQIAVITVNLGPTHKDRPVKQMSALVVNELIIISKPYIFL